jgi:HJR/Mrr/RecB family endonuclease
MFVPPPTPLTKKEKLTAVALLCCIVCLACAIIFLVRWSLASIQSHWFCLILLALPCMYVYGAFSGLYDLTPKRRQLLKKRTAQRAMERRSEEAKEAARLAAIQTQFEARRAREGAWQDTILNATGISAEMVNEMSPRQFEDYVAKIFKHMGYEVHVIGGSGDQGVDVIAEKGSTRWAIQVKKYRGLVSNSAVQQVVAGKIHHRCNRCMLVTNSRFTRAAFDLAKSTKCILIDGKRLRNRGFDSWMGV